MTLPVVTARGWRGGAFAAGPGAPAADTGVTRQDNLVVWYKMDETAGSTISDSSGNDRHATAYAMADDDWITGKNGNALNFDGTDDYAKDDGSSKAICNAMNRSGPADSQGPWSISFWLKKENNTAAGIFTFSNTKTSTVPWMYGRTLDAGSGNMKLEFYPTTAPFYLRSDAWAPDSNWHHIVLTFSGSVFKLYRNASLNTTATETMAFTNANGQQLFLGSAYGGWGAAKVLDDFRLYDIELDSDEVSAIYGSGDGDF